MSEVRFNVGDFVYIASHIGYVYGGQIKLIKIYKDCVQYEILLPGRGDNDIRWHNVIDRECYATLEGALEKVEAE